uniref:DUF4220 domain-containing protein n=2 Tax=Quercus lobata TaxID=97700 RepID=A0A7N2N0Z8_QUELO
MILLIWISYLLADWAASFAVGHISSGQGSSSGSNDKGNSFVGHFFSMDQEKVARSTCKGGAASDENAELLAFWAPFLLLHLGGPDTITAFALEDNALWLRHLFGLLVQVAVTVYIFILTLPKNGLLVPTVLMFVAGIIKYCERTRALFLASLDRFRESMRKQPDPGPNYAKLMEEYSSKKEAGLPTKIEMTPEPGKESKLATLSLEDKETLTEIDVVKYAHKYFKIFRGLIVDLIFSFRERNESRDFFRKRSAEDAFKVIELELNFIYEAFFTKVVVVHTKFGCFVRVVSTCCIVGAYLFFLFMEKDHLKEFDIMVTYTLLVGGMCLDAIAFFMLISSDWTIATVNINSPKSTCFKKIAKRYLQLKSSKWDSEHKVLSTHWLIRRWSESVAKFSLIDYCVRLRRYEFKDFCIMFCIDKGVDYLGGRELVNGLKYVKGEKLPKKLWEFIFNELLAKSREAADDAEATKNICSARGAYAIQNEDWESNVDLVVINKITEDYIENVAYDESLLLWHVATELCYHDLTLTTITTKNDKNDSRKEDDAKTNSECDYQKFSKLLSDYMLYLLVMQGSMMSAVAGIAQIRYRDTCAEAENFFIRRGLKRNGVRQACEEILSVDTEVKPVHVKGDRSKSVLFDACMLAKELEKLKGKKWKIISKVWVEMLSYAASHCRPDTHAQQVSRGGQLISFVWLLMAHFGLGEQFQINEGHARAKLIVGK